MEKAEFITKLFTQYGPKTIPEKMKDTYAQKMKEYESYLTRFSARELDLFWNFFRDRYEFSSLPAIGKIETMRKDYCRERGSIGEAVNHEGPCRTITPDNMNSFPPAVQIEWAQYWLSMCIPDTSQFKKMLAVIRRHVGDPAADQEEKRIRANHADHKHCKHYSYCVNGEKKEAAAKKVSA